MDIYKRLQIWILTIKSTKMHLIRLTVVIGLQIEGITMCRKAQLIAISVVIVALCAPVWLVLMHVVNVLVVISFRAFDEQKGIMWTEQRELHTVAWLLHLL